MKIDENTLIMGILLICGILLFVLFLSRCSLKCFPKESMSEPTTGCGYLNMQLENLANDWTADQIQQANQLCQEYTNKCGDASARQAIMKYYGMETI